MPGADAGARIRFGAAALFDSAAVPFIAVDAAAATAAVNGAAGWIARPASAVTGQTDTVMPAAGRTSLCS